MEVDDINIALERNITPLDLQLNMSSDVQLEKSTENVHFIGETLNQSQDTGIFVGVMSVNDDVKAEQEKEEIMAIDIPTESSYDPNLMVFYSAPEVNQIIRNVVDAKSHPFVLTKAHVIAIGNYILNQEHGYPLWFTEFGFSFEMPHSKTPDKMVSMCIPIAQLVQARLHFGRDKTRVYLKTGSCHASWIQETLGLQGGNMSKTSYYYCPLTGLTGNQKWIALYLEPFSENDAQFITKVLQSDWILKFNLLSSMEHHIFFNEKIKRTIIPEKFFFPQPPIF